MPPKVTAPAVPKPMPSSRNPIGKKNMFATQCSKPAATNALMGSRIPITLSTTVRAEKPIHTARQTKTLHMMPLKNSVIQSGDTLPAATLTIASPTAPPFIA